MDELVSPHRHSTGFTPDCRCTTLFLGSHETSVGRIAKNSRLPRPRARELAGAPLRSVTLGAGLSRFARPPGGATDAEGDGAARARRPLAKCAQVVGWQGTAFAKANAPLAVELAEPAPQMCQAVADRALQAHGGMGVTQDTPIARIYLTSRYCRIADGPDEVHMSQLGRRTIRDAL